MAQHLKDKHDGVNSSGLQEQPAIASSSSAGGFDLGELLTRKLETASARGVGLTAVSSSRQSRNQQHSSTAAPQDIHTLLKVHFFVDTPI